MIAHDSITPEDMMSATRTVLALAAAFLILAVCTRPSLAQGPYQGDSTSVYGGQVQQPSYGQSPPPLPYSQPVANPSYESPGAYDGPPPPRSSAPPPQSEYTPPPSQAPAAPDLVQVMQKAGQFSTFLQLADVAGYTDALHRGGPYTVFAPTDAAFQRLPPGTVRNMLNSRTTAISFVRFHIVKGKLRVADLLRAAAPVQTLQGNTLQIGRGDGHVTLNGAAIIAPDEVANNGVVQGLNAFLLPVYPGAREGQREPDQGQPADGTGAPPAAVQPAAPPPPTVVPTPPKTGAYPPGSSGGPAYYR
jgi:uncharacterized surface protein with fasciclin (FAS1) repeats